MNRTRLGGLFVAIVLLHGAWVVYTQSQKPPGPLRIEKVKGDYSLTVDGSTTVHGAGLEVGGIVAAKVVATDGVDLVAEVLG